VGQEPRMSEEPTSVRCEYHYDPTHPAYQLLRKRAKERRKSIQRMINEAILEWYVLTQASPTSQPPPPPPVEEESAAKGAQHVADEWL
jgi:hypothetical protein